MTAMTRTAWALLILLSVLWGGSFFFVAVAIESLPVISIVWLRAALAALALWALIWIGRVPLKWSRGAVVACIGAGLLNNVIPHSLIVYGQASIPSGLASILNATTPLFTVVALHLLTADDKLNRQKIAGVAFGLAGVIVLIGPGVLRSGAPVLAQVSVLGGALFYGLAGVWARRFKSLGLSPLGIAAGQLTASSVFLLPVTLMIDKPWTLSLPGWEPITAVLGLAILSTALAYVIFFRILELAGPANLSLVTLLIPVSAALLGWAVLSERLGWGDFAGAVLIGAGLVAMDGRALRFLKRASTEIG